MDIWDTRFHVDYPRPNETYAGIIPIQGWAISRIKPVFVEVYFDEKKVADLRVDKRRPDVLHQYPESPNALDSGFAASVHTDLLEHGAHQARFRLRYREGFDERAIELCSFTVGIGPREERFTPYELFYTKDCLKQWGDRVSVGDYTYGNPEIKHWGEDAKLTIGRFCSIANEVVILLGGDHRSDWATTYPFPTFQNEWPEASEIGGHPVTKGNVVIGNDVWVGYGATILSGIRIGDDAIVGARSVVSRDVPPYTIVAGNPAREIGKRFSSEQIEELLRMRWWDWPIEKIRANLDILCSSNIEMLRRRGT